MNIEDYFEEVKGITVDAARNCGARYTAIDICRFAKKYHERQVEILNLQRVSNNEVACCDNPKLDIGMQHGFGKNLCKNCGGHIAI